MALHNYVGYIARKKTLEKKAKDKKWGKKVGETKPKGKESKGPKLEKTQRLHYFFREARIDQFSLFKKITTGVWGC